MRVSLDQVRVILRKLSSVVWSRASHCAKACECLWIRCESLYESMLVSLDQVRVTVRKLSSVVESGVSHDLLHHIVFTGVLVIAMAQFLSMFLIHSVAALFLRACVYLCVCVR